MTFDPACRAVRGARGAPRTGDAGAAQHGQEARPELRRGVPPRGLHGVEASGGAEAQLHAAEGQRSERAHAPAHRRHHREGRVVETDFQAAHRGRRPKGDSCQGAGQDCSSTEGKQRLQAAGGAAARGQQQRPPARSLAPRRGGGGAEVLEDQLTEGKLPRERGMPEEPLRETAEVHKVLPLLLGRGVPPRVVDPHAWTGCRGR
mmetsp:Transcript_41904/g.125273  ORF Transcript_41904/g.125273 Transcript_41904/m.125273 type:complete len:204 (-) Transcript_41904:1035-1646(-)